MSRAPAWISGASAPFASSSLPERLFGLDPDRMYAFYRIEAPWWLALAMSEPNGIASALYRPDFVDTARGFRCIEVNGGNPGGWLLSSLAPRPA